VRTVTAYIMLHALSNTQYYYNNTIKPDTTVTFFDEILLYIIPRQTDDVGTDGSEAGDFFLEYIIIY